MRNHTCIWNFAYAFVAFACATSGSAIAADKHPAELKGYWATQRVTVDGKEDGGQEGSYLILRDNGTFRIAKKGRKPEGNWEVTADNKLILKVGDQQIMSAEWSIKEENLTLNVDEGKRKVTAKYLKKKLDKEPKAPDEK